MSAKLRLLSRLILPFFFVAICIAVIIYISVPTSATELVEVQKDFGEKLYFRDTAGKEQRPKSNSQISNRVSNVSTPYFLEKIHLTGDDNVTYKPLDVYNSDVVEKFTIVIQTCNRTDLLLRLLNDLSAVQGVDRILVVWNNIGIVPPYELWESLGPHPTEVLFLIQLVNRLRNRLQPFEEIRTEGVLMLDDDHLYGTRDIEFAFRVWKQNRNKLVGFFARKHVELSNGIFVYGGPSLDSGTRLGRYSYSLILIGATFMHREYLEIFNSDEVPSAVREMIDQKDNCEDIALNFVVGRHLAKTSVAGRQCVGVYVEPMYTINRESKAVSGYKGKWNEDILHFNIRSQCINTLARLYGGIPFSYCDMVLITYSDFIELKRH